MYHTPKSKKDASALLAKLNNLAIAYCVSKIHLTDFSMNHEYFQAIKSLCSNKNILITKSDKDFEVVIFNYMDYTAKWNLFQMVRTNFNAWD